ncbi:ABC transporter substrate-binding protein [Nocardioides sp. TF02-7]|uniref:ABC transporter substrate-binding protein n=1 Tax=Nocardioides sp. TF02-7 TaxID=2917724 RepID=UPI001F06937E|nr:ABC transporter substrate-binding protein [Nocardioides sp. TF02-7]UMG91183.1 ABC transporter substrate-binding protein [Nocardioides sp. TF02-7]
MKIVLTAPVTGVVAHVGSSARDGYELAIEEINNSDLLGDTELVLDVRDTKSEAQTAATEMTKAISDAEVSAVFGSQSSAEAVAQSPLAQQHGMPIVYTQAGSDGVIVGEYTYRATPLMRNYYPLLADFVEENGWQSVAQLYANYIPTLSDIGENALPALAEETGMEVTASLGSPQSTQDFTSQVQKALDSDPDVVAVNLFAASNPTAVSQLRQAGYEGPILSTVSAGSGVLTPAGDDASDVVWAADFHVDMEAESTQAFVAAYREKYDEDPLPYAAEAYDAAYFLARAIAEADSAGRDEIADAMAVVSEETHDGALGRNLVWEDQELQVPGVVIRWDGEGEELLYEGES